MTSVPTMGVQKVEDLALSLVGRGVGVVTGVHGIGKSVALSLAKARVEAREDRPRVVLVDCVRGGNVATLAEVVAKALDITIPGNRNPVAYLSTLRARLVTRNVRLVIADNVDNLDEGCREHLLRLIDTAHTIVPHRIGLLVTENPSNRNSFIENASHFGYRPHLLEMPGLTPEEVAGFLARAFPEIADDLARQLTSPAVHHLVAELMAECGGRPLTLEDLLLEIRHGGGKITLTDIQSALNTPVPPKPKKNGRHHRNGHSTGVI